MTDDLDTLRPEVREAVNRIEYSCTMLSNCGEDYKIIVAELLRFGRENDEWQTRCLQFQTERDKARAELAALKARIAGSSVVKIANYGDPFIVLPDHFTVPNSLKGKTVHLVLVE